MPGNWDEESSGDEAPKVIVPKAKSKWDDEEEDDDVLESWDAAEDSEDEAKKKAKAEEAAAIAAANKKSKSERIALKQAENAKKKQEEEEEAFRRENETPAEKRERERQRQIEEDLKHAEDLFGGAMGSDTKKKAIAITDPKDPGRVINLADMAIFNPKTKSDFAQMREVLVPLLTSLSKKPTYQDFMVDFAKELCKELNSEATRKVASGLTTLSNEKQRAEKDAAGGKKKGKGAAKTKLAAVSKASDRVDTTDYAGGNTYDDFDDFM